MTLTGKSLSEALIFASINPKYDNRLFMELPWKVQAQNMGRTCSAHVQLMFCVCSFHGNSMNNLLSYCGVVDARISVSEKKLPVKGQCLDSYFYIPQKTFRFIAHPFYFQTEKREYFSCPSLEFSKKKYENNFVH